MSRQLQTNNSLSMALAVKFHVGLIGFLLLKQRSCKIKYGILICTCIWLAGVFQVLSCPTSYGIVPVMALMLKMLNVMSHVDPYLHVHHPRCLLCMSIDVIPAGWQETFRSTASRLAADLKVSCQPAGRRHFL